jgi:pyruvate/2-oxoglutarate dehydrogenase complex dihydrolipoamide dehydrogenase (E3) component
VTVIECGPQIMSREDPDVSRELQRILGAEGIQFVCAAEPLNERGRSGEEVSVTVRTASGERTIGGTDILVAAGRARSASAVHGDRNYLPLILWRTRRRPGDRLHLPASRGDRAGC